MEPGVVEAADQKPLRALVPAGSRWNGSSESVVTCMAVFAAAASRRPERNPSAS
jgi:hypothetical protein